MCCLSSSTVKMVFQRWHCRAKTSRDSPPSSHRESSNNALDTAAGVHAKQIPPVDWIIDFQIKT